MLERDVAAEKCLLYYVPSDEKAFYSQISSNNNELQLLPKNIIRQLQESAANFKQQLGATVAASALSAVLAPKLIPFSQRIQSKLFSAVLRIAILILPSYCLLSYKIRQVSELKQTAFRSVAEQYTHYIRSGDILTINSKVELV